ncbi:MAG: hypothetical protein ACE15F_17965 [bacterium]
MLRKIRSTVRKSLDTLAEWRYAFLKKSTGLDLVFIHHSCGKNWLRQGLRSALFAKPYIRRIKEIEYGSVLTPDPGRPDSLGPVPGGRTNMNHWLFWFNDYLDGVLHYPNPDGKNRIILFKSCFPISNIEDEGDGPGDPFSVRQILANYQSIYRNAMDPAGEYSFSNYSYKPLEKIFAGNPDILFIAVTAPPRHYAPMEGTNDEEARRARRFNQWLKTEWLESYHQTRPGLRNVAVFDWFDCLAYPDDHSTHPNRLRSEYGGEAGDSHPHRTANHQTAGIFSDFLDAILSEWTGFHAEERVKALQG